MKCKFYIDKHHNIQDGYGNSCKSSKSIDTICPYYGEVSKCSIGELPPEKKRKNSLDESYYKNILLTLLAKFPSYSEKDIARVLAGLALAADEKAAYNTIDVHKTIQK